MLKMIFFDEDPDEVLKEEDISADVNSGIERIDFRDTEEVGTKKGHTRLPNFHQSDLRTYLHCTGLTQTKVVNFFKLSQSGRFGRA